MIKIKKGNLLNSKEDAIAHGCNCINVMGAGVAKQINLKWTGVMKADWEYRKFILEKFGNDEAMMGTYSYFKTGDMYIFNLYTQHMTGPCFKIELLFSSLYSVIFDFRAKINSIGLPWIGCGIGGGDRDKVRDIFELISKWFPEIEMVIYER